MCCGSYPFGKKEGLGNGLEKLRTSGFWDESFPEDLPEATHLFCVIGLILVEQTCNVNISPSYGYPFEFDKIQ